MKCIDNANGTGSLRHPAPLALCAVIPQKKPPSAPNRVLQMPETRTDPMVHLNILLRAGWDCIRAWNSKFFKIFAWDTWCPRWCHTAKVNSSCHSKDEDWKSQKMSCAFSGYSMKATHEAKEWMAGVVYSHCYIAHVDTRQTHAHWGSPYLHHPIHLNPIIVHRFVQKHKGCWSKHNGCWSEATTVSNRCVPTDSNKYIKDRARMHSW